MFSNGVKLITAALLVTTLISSCSAADDTLKILPKLAKSIDPPPIKPPSSIPIRNSQTAQDLQDLIKAMGERARNAKQLGKTAALRVPLTDNQEAYEQSLWKVAYETVLEEMQRYASKATKAELRGMVEQMASEIVAEVAAAPVPSQPEQSAAINATISGKSGSKNIRSGPGTTYDVTHTVYPGDRIVILGKNQDQGGYIWYKIQLNSGHEGWIASQLVQPD